MTDAVEHLKTPAPQNHGATESVTRSVATILDDVRARGDAAVRDATSAFDGMTIDHAEVSDAEIETARSKLDADLLADMRYGIERITDFAERQLATLSDLACEPIPGLHLGHRHIPIQNVGCYVPGGRYPLLSAAQMTIIPAKVAGVEEVVACTPPNAHPAVLVAAKLSGADRIYRIGGAQAVAAMAFGTESVPTVAKIVGPGNKFVNEAKRQVFGTVGIDQLAGPSEIYVLADGTGDPRTIAADLLGQAEHDVMARAGLITTSRSLANAVLDEVDRQLASLTTRDTAGPAWAQHGEIAVCPSLDVAIAYADRVAPEHLQIHTDNPHEVARRLTNYGSLFIGTNASVVYADKIAGPNHTLPTQCAARYTGGLWVGSYIKTCTHQWLDDQALNAIAPVATRQSEREGLDGHRRAALLRIDPNAV